VEKSCQAIDYTLPAPVACDEVKCPFFHFRKYRSTVPEMLRNEVSPMVIFDPSTMKSTLVPAGVPYATVSGHELYITTFGFRF